MANIADLFRSLVLPREPVSENIDPQMGDKGAGIVLRSMLEQLQSLPSAAPQGIRPNPELDTFLFNLDPRGEFGNPTHRNRALSSKFFGDLI